MVDAIRMAARRVLLIVMVVATAVVVGVGGTVVGIRVHRSHVASRQLTAALRIAHGVSLEGAHSSTACPNSGEISCLTTSLPVLATAGDVAKSMGAASGRQPRIRCFHNTFRARKPGTPYDACVVDLRFGAHTTFAWINVNPLNDASFRHPEANGSTVSLNVS
jgi:hypothetical protein